MSTKPKPTPANLNWGGIDKGLNIFKTSLLQKVGRQDRKEVPQEFVLQTERVKQLKKLLVKLIDEGKHFVKTLQGSFANSATIDILWTNIGILAPFVPQLARTQQHQLFHATKILPILSYLIISLPIQYRMHDTCATDSLAFESFVKFAI